MVLAVGGPPMAAPSQAAVPHGSARAVLGDPRKPLVLRGVVRCGGDAQGCRTNHRRVLPAACSGRLPAVGFGSSSRAGEAWQTALALRSAAVVRYDGVALDRSVRQQVQRHPGPSGVGRSALTGALPDRSAAFAKRDLLVVLPSFLPLL